MRYIIVVLLLALFSRIDLSLAARCALDPDLSGLGEEIPIESDIKLSISGFAASYSYVTLPSGKKSFSRLGKMSSFCLFLSFFMVLSLVV